MLAAKLYENLTVVLNYSSRLTSVGLIHVGPIRIIIILFYKVVV